MKTFRILGAVFCVIGCFCALLGVLSAVIPMIENEQLKLIVNSFQETSADPLTNTLNAVVNFCLHSGYFLLFAGISLTVTGGLIGSSAHRRQKGERSAVAEIVPLQIPLKPSGAPKPAYYPGGTEPPPDTPAASDERAVPIVSTMKMPVVQLLPEDDEPDLTFIENDSQKLMRNDAVLSAQAQFRRPSAPDYSRYSSNAAPLEPEEEEHQSPQAQPKRPRIVSTMGKKTL